MSEQVSRISSESPFIQQRALEEEVNKGSVLPVTTPAASKVNDTLIIENVNTKPVDATNAKATSVLPPDTSSYFSGLMDQLDHIDRSIAQAQEELNNPELRDNLDHLSPEDHAVLSHALNTATAYVDLATQGNFTQKMAIGMSEILQLVNEMRHLVGAGYHADMQRNLSNMMRQYDAKIEHMYEAAKADFSAGLAKGIGGIGAGAIGAIPVVGAAGQISSGTGDTIGAIYQYKADKEKAEQAKMEGLIAGSQNILDGNKKFYESLKQWTDETRSNVQKIVEDSESSKQSTIRNI